MQFQGSMGNKVKNWKNSRVYFRLRNPTRRRLTHTHTKIYMYKKWSGHAVENVLSFGIIFCILSGWLAAKPVERSAALDSESTFLKRNGIKLRATGLLSPYKVPCPLYRKTFPVSVGDSSFSELPPSLRAPFSVASAPCRRDAQMALEPHKRFVFSQQTASAARPLPEQEGSLGFRKEKAWQLPKSIAGWETMARPVWILSRPPPLSPFLFAPSDHGCRLQFVLSALAREHRGDLTNIGRAACQKGEKDGGGNARNVVIAAISRNEEEGGEKKNNLENGNRKAVRRAVRSKQTRISRASSFDVCVRCSSLAAGHAGTIAGKWELL